MLNLLSKSENYMNNKELPTTAPFITRPNNDKWMETLHESHYLL